MREGADPEKLEQLANRFRSAAERIDDELRELRQMADHALWHGADAREFGTILEGELRIRLNRGTSLLRDAATELVRQADGQRTASRADGTTTSAPGPRASGPSGPWFGIWPLIRFFRQWWRSNLPEPAPPRADPTHGVPSGVKDFSAVPLFGADGRPDIGEVRQGNVGDCYLAAALAGMTMTPEGRAAIARMITANKDGTYTVHFPDGDETVDADLYVDENGHPMYGGGFRSPDALWFPLIEKAYAQHKGSYGGIEGGSAADTAAAFIGARANALGKGSGQEAFANTGRELAAGHLVYASTPATLPGGGSTWTGSGHPGPTVHANHAYTVVGTEMRGGQQMIELRNPWGSPAANEGEYVWMSADDFAKVFTNLESVS